MNKHNKQKFNEVKNVETDDKIFHLFMERISFKQKIVLFFGMAIKTRRSVLFLSCLHRGMSPFSAHNVAYSNTIDNVANLLHQHGWRVSFGKLD